ncbi:MAG: hypothetical protein K9J80_12955 [Sulfuritalea sp.]|nr:hypothetical protein [Sulfuritalea sp.]MCF8185028.1 hypothetical protein [Polynucleobacter sp.]
MTKDQPHSTATPAPADQASAFDPEFFRGLCEMEETTFPKQCRTCGQVYQDSRDFIARTVGIGPRKGVKTSLDDDGSPVLEFFRNCVCGSTLHGLYAERRDSSEKGLKRRVKFDELMKRLEDHGFAYDVARNELLKLLRGQESELLAPFLRRTEGSGPG